MSDWLTLKNALNLTLRPIQDWPGKPHPDNSVTGDTERFLRLQQAKDLLDRTQG